MKLFDEDGSPKKPGLSLSAPAAEKAGPATQTDVDVSELLRTEHALKEANKRWSIAADAAGLGIWEYDVKTKTSTWDDRIYRLFGLAVQPRDETGELWQKIVHPEDIGRLEREMQQAINGDREHDSEFRILRPDGSVRHVKTHARVERDDLGQALRMVGVNYDITDLKKKDEALRESENRYKSIYNSMHIGIFRSTPQGRVLWVNDAMVAIYGYDSQEDLLSTPAGAYYEDNQDRARMLQLLEQDGQALNFVTRENRKDGSRIWISCDYQAVRDSDGRIEFIDGLVLDITGLKTAEEAREKLQLQLSQAQKMESVGRLAGGVAHDFNNMLGVILGHAELALMRLDGENPLAADLRAIQQAGERSAELTRQLLAFARRQAISPKVQNLNDVLEEMLKMLRRLVGEDIDLVWKPGHTLWPVKVDKSQIDQILANLCVNSRDAIDGTGRISIETANLSLGQTEAGRGNGQVASGDFVRITVSDTGCGMAPETLERLFEPFFTTKPVGKGTGLGLATVYGIVEQNRGFIEVQSRVGRGTVFCVHLPRHEEAGEPARDLEEGATEQVPGGGETVLLVEDDPAILNIVTLMLGQLGYRLLVANSPSKAIELVKRSHGGIDLLITDVIMPEMNGRDLVDHLTREYPGLKAIFMSGYTADIIARHGVLEGGINFIQKPFSWKDLAHRVRNVLDSRLTPGLAPVGGPGA
jgi:PAS domain S-box-containing protein